MPELLVVMPVYNESAAIGHVLGGWLAELDASGCDYRLLAIDDGSTDDTFALLSRWKDERPDRMEVRTRGNRGHGQTCLEGYREAVARGFPMCSRSTRTVSRCRFFRGFLAAAGNPRRDLRRA